MDPKPKSPFALLQDQAHRVCNESVRQLVEHKTPCISERWYAVCLFDAHVLLVPFEEITEIVAVPHLTPIPWVKSWVVGMGVFQRDMLPVTDPGLWLFQKKTPIDRRSRIIIVRHRWEYTGFLVGRLVGLQHGSNEHFVAIDTKDEFQDGYGPFLLGFWKRDELCFPVISLLKMIQSDEFNEVFISQ